ncbi:transposase [Embleya sp. NPDC059259]|uniref:transposase n=1 Tax=unclassified Embleya TaxID=2699296 RepID=UPI00368B2616
MGRGDLTDDQWAVPEPLLPKATRTGRPPVRPRRRPIDGIRFRLRTGVSCGTCPSSTDHGAGSMTCSANGRGTAPGTGSSRGYGLRPTRRV